MQFYLNDNVLMLGYVLNINENSQKYCKANCDALTLLYLVEPEDKIDYLLSHDMIVSLHKHIYGSTDLA